MADVKFKPLGNRIVVQPLEEEAQVSAGGIYIPDTAKEKPCLLYTSDAADE